MNDPEPAVDRRSLKMLHCFQKCIPVSANITFFLPWFNPYILGSMPHSFFLKHISRYRCTRVDKWIVNLNFSKTSLYFWQARSAMHEPHQLPPLASASHNIPHAQMLGLFSICGVLGNKNERKE